MSDSGLRTRRSSSALCQSYPARSIGGMSASIRDRLVALALYRMVSATTETDEAHPQSHSNADPISLLERLYRLKWTVLKTSRSAAFLIPSGWMDSEQSMRGQPGFFDIDDRLKRCLSRSTFTCATPLDGMRTSGPRNGYQAPPALPRARLNHEYGALHGDIA
jgi:hypothetical protein